MYKIRDDIEGDTLPVEVTKECPYKGVVFRILEVRFDEQEDGSAHCNFDYDIMDDIGIGEVELRKSAEFEGILADILKSFIDMAVKNAEKESASKVKIETTEEEKVGRDNKNRKNDIKELDIQ